VSRGIIIVAFGQEYDRVAAAAWKYSQTHTTLPLCVLTNLPKAQRSPKWDTCQNFVMIEHADPVNKNRQYKTSLCDHTPFDETLYMDATCVLRRAGIEHELDMLQEHDMLFHHYLSWGGYCKRVLKIYQRAMQKFHVALPVDMPSGCVFAFRKNDKVRKFFTTWNMYWLAFGAGWEMPPLMCARKHSVQSGLFAGWLTEAYYAVEYEGVTAIVQRLYDKQIAGQFDVPDHKHYHPFDTDPTDFTWVDYKPLECKGCGA